MPDVENSRKTAEKGCRVGHGKTAEKQPENTRNTLKTDVFRVFRVFFRLFFGCFTVTHSAPFSAVFRLFQRRAFGTSVAGRGDCKSRLSRDCHAEFGRPLTKKVMSHSLDGPGVTAPLRTNIVLSPGCGITPLPLPHLKKSPM